MKSHVGFIGLGVMGRPMALNLMRAGHSVHVFARRPSSVAPLVEQGATGSHRDRSQHDPSGHRARRGGAARSARGRVPGRDSVGRGDRGDQRHAFDHGGGNRVCLRECRTAASLCRQDSAAHRRAGAGQVAKATNQLAIVLALEGLAEAFTRARAAGVDPAKVLEALRGGVAASPILEAMPRSSRGGQTFNALVARSGARQDSSA